MSDDHASRTLGHVIVRERPSLRDVNKDTVSAAIVASIFGCVATSLIIIASGNDADLTTAQTASWLTAAWFFGGALGFVIALNTRQPISGAWSIPGAVMLASALKDVSFAEAVGAYFVSGVLVLILGLTGFVNVVMRFIPMPVIMAMIAGALMRFATGVISALEELPLVVAPTVIAYFVAARFIRQVHPVVVAVIVAVIATVATGSTNEAVATSGFMLPLFTIPEFSLSAVLAISLPLTILVIGAENAQAAGVLIAEGYRPPVKKMTIFSGIGGMVSSFFGGPNANIAGPMTAICASDASGKDKRSRYMASAINGLICLTFGALSSIAVGWISAIPISIVMAVAGLAMIGVLTQSLEFAFMKNTNARTGAFVALVVALSEISLFGVSAPLWALIAGSVIAYVVDGAGQAAKAQVE